jgi:hypothetical protein
MHNCLRAYKFQFLVFGLACALSTNFAMAAVVGNIVVDTYTPYQTGATATDQSGVTLTAHYDITDPMGLANCCASGNLRWLQLVNSSTATGFTPTPNRPFIDPRQGQNGGDNLPYYDFTYPTSALTTANNGVGPYIFDKPAVNNNRAVTGTPYSFTADTVLVCIYDSSGNPIKLTILGGFEWGFTIASDGGMPASYAVAARPITPLADGLALRNSFNTALALDFPGYTVVPCAGTTCDGVTFALVPEPSTWLFSGVAIVFLLRRSRRMV